ncbi:DNA (cytosine-5-)-methyltransferase [Vibrio sp. Of7-15]|uniref:DNA (cytosine-5-)-methyltransferase n=1 Tax=Vibrio sp. Of7-15 TaxID=2724879 RepID=UPI001EF388AA|nr:DNA (cytosine-5-)-methyltransferase [Vibrio sp. Of7-15]MCG7500022.1 DNA (cytosine-5-)-methyltransferase [Vibrio sp. Of7-15]
MRYNEILKGDLEDEERIERNLIATNKLLKLLITIYDQKNLAIKFQELGGNYSEITREKLNKWKANPNSGAIIFHERALKDLKDHLLPNKPTHWDNPEFTFIDLFAGIGGLRKGFEDVGGKCIFTSEWDASARRTYLANHYVDEHELPYFLDNEEDNVEKNISYMDITKITQSSNESLSEEDKQASILKHIPKHDLLLAGFPCQPFSLAGVSKKNSLGRAHGFECDTQGTLFFDVEQILITRQPKYFVLENVKNLKSHDKGNTFATIIRALDRAGYWVSDISNVDDDIEEAIKEVRKRKPEPTVIDGSNFTPQHRERIILVGIRKDLVEREPNLQKLSLHNIEKPEKRYTLAEILCPLSDAEKKKYTLTPNLWNYLYHYALKHQTKGNGFGFGLVDPNNPNVVTRTLSARYYKDGSEILINQDGLEPEYLMGKREHGIKKNLEREAFAKDFAEKLKLRKPEINEKDYKLAIKEGEKDYDEKEGRYAKEFEALYKTPRRLTPRECARLMGFEKPEFDRSESDTNFRIVCADTAAYKQFGNSVVVPVFRSVAKLLKQHM